MTTLISKVLLVDDHPLMRRGIGQLLSLEDCFDVVGEASNGVDAISLANELDPDIILLDLNMKGMSGLDTLKTMRKEGIDSQIIILTVSDNPADINALVKAQADGYLLKDTEPEELIELLKQAQQGETVYSRLVKEHLDTRDETGNLLDQLTDREMQILQEVAKGFRNKQIADQLFISESTVKVHMKSLLKKLNVASRTAATVLYLDTYGRD
ncbi:response regulator [Vibrio gangliei]|uniref:response regulator n=1 Tax=Vibrio gangliei TaxID=2077090 RepID=UPI000D014759|nr:response regulator [Vibrio gangliei]